MSITNHISKENLAKFSPVNQLSPDQIEELADQTAIEYMNEGDVVFKAGSSLAEFVYLLKGNVVLDNGQQNKTISADTERALTPLDASTPRQFTATAQGPIEYVRLDSELIECLVTWGQIAAPEPEVVMTDEGVFTIDKASWLKKMAKSPTFKHLPPANIEQLLDKLEPMKVEAGEVIIRQGDVGDYFYMIDKGDALVNRQTEDEEDESIELAELSEGSSFGEAALISDKPRNATISMMSDGILLRLSKDDFLTLLNEPNIQWITFEEGVDLVIAKKAVWIDIRLPSEHAEGHIPLSENIPIQQLHRRSRGLDKETQYICYCDTGRRSSAAAFILNQYGLHAYVLKDGLKSVDQALLKKS